MKKVRHFFIVAVSLFFFSSSFAQSVTPAVLNASGGTNFFTFYRFEWSFGEAMVIETQSASNLIVTQGVLQPETHNPATNSTTSTWDKDEIKILPNPTQNVLEIDFFSKQKGKVTMSFYDATGRFMSNRQFDYYGTSRIEKWNVTAFPAGTYMLYIELVPVSPSVAKKGAFKVVKVN
jgi:Secretion system C-terminal sorting domain